MPKYAKRTQSVPDQYAKRTQFAPTATDPQPKYAKRTQFPHTKCPDTPKKYETNPIYRPASFTPPPFSQNEPNLSHGKDLPDSPSDNKRRVRWSEGWINALATGKTQRMNPDFRYNRHLLYNLSRPEKSLLLLAPLSKAAGGYGTCKSKNTESAPAFDSTEDTGYQTLLQSIRDGKKYLEKIKRFDMPGFQPLAEYLRQLRRYGLIPEAEGSDVAPFDVYQLERRYWNSVNQRALSFQDTSQP